MKTPLYFVLLAAMFGTLPAARAADQTLPIEFRKAVRVAASAGDVDSSVGVYLKGRQPSGEVLRVLPDVVAKATSKMPSPDGRSDAQICEIIFRKVLAELQDKAKEWGANAVVDIEGLDAGDGQQDTFSVNCRLGSAYDHFIILSGRPAVVRYSGQR